MDYQATLKRSIEFSGVGLHSGKTATVRIHPAEVDTGIVFTKNNITIPALSSSVVDSQLSTTLGKNKITIATVEHLISALWGMQVDNVKIEVIGSEIPILDGSSYLFVKAIRKAGLKVQDKPRRHFVITKPVSVIEGDRYGYLLPHRTPKISCSVEFNHPLIKKQMLEMAFTPVEYMQKISKAKTFGFLKDFDQLKKLGLIAGGSLENAIVLDETKVLNPEGLRYKDEFVRHKILDLIGDIALMGIRILGHVVAHKSGHRLHYELIQKALKEECGYIVGVTDESETVPSLVPDLQPISA